MIETQRLVLRPFKETYLDDLYEYFKEFVSFVNDEHGYPIYENTYEYAVLKKEWNKK